jgi:16S rRNA (uracil1498-N3)-methyltransferase
MTSAPVFLAGPGLLAAAAPGSSYVLDGAEARHAGVVQRRRVGERVDVVDGEGTRLSCVIAVVEPGRLVLDVTDRLFEPPPEVRLVLVQALAKGDRDELAIQAATEVGADDVVPWQAARSVVVWRGDRVARSQARWQVVIREATKQSRRSRVPVLREAVTTAGLAGSVREVVGAGGAAFVLSRFATAGLDEAPLPVPDGDGTPQVMVIVGPEGGIAEQEAATLGDAGAVAARLGPHVLRTSTAGPVAIALLAQRLGRWKGTDESS